MLGDVLVVAAALASGLVAWILWRRPWRGVRTRYPIILAHGVMGFSRLAIGTYKRDYFHGVVEHLEGLGLRVSCPAVPAVASVAERAAALAKAIDAFDAPKVHIIAHSMGGLDARYVISVLGKHNRVASLTTLGTPHLGTSVAKAAGLAGPLLPALGLRAFSELTPEAMRTFNKKVPNARGVRYLSVVSTAREGDVTSWLIPTHTYLLRAEGPNDGLVSAASQRWGKVLFEAEADHWAQIGWSKSFVAPPAYERILRYLRAHRG